MASVKDIRVAVIASDGTEEAELIKPVQALRDAGAKVDILSPKGRDIQCFSHHDKAGKVKATRSLEDARPDEYEALMLPGGALNADQLRVDHHAQRFVQSFDKAKKPIAFICHAPWLLISANVVRGRTLTSFHTIEDDVRNAGGHWADREVVLDFNWVSSRKPDDIPAFNREMINTFAVFAGNKTQSA